MVGVLAGQGNPVGASSGAAGLVCGQEVAGEHRPRGAVGGDVVDRQHQQGAIGGILVQARPDRTVAGEVVGHRDEFARPFLGIDDGPVEVGVRGDHLVRASVGTDRVGGAQDLMAGDDVADRGPDVVGADAPADPERERDDVGRHIGLVLVEEPHPTLGAGQRQRLRPRSRCRGRRHRGQPGGAGEPSGQSADRRFVEDVTHCHRGVEHPADTRREPGGGE